MLDCRHSLQAAARQHHAIQAYAAEPISALPERAQIRGQAAAFFCFRKSTPDESAVFAVFRNGQRAARADFVNFLSILVWGFLCVYNICRNVKVYIDLLCGRTKSVLLRDSRG